MADCDTERTWNGHDPRGHRCPILAADRRPLIAEAIVMNRPVSTLINQRMTRFAPDSGLVRNSVTYISIFILSTIPNTSSDQLGLLRDGCTIRKYDASTYRL